MRELAPWAYEAIKQAAEMLCDLCDEGRVDTAVEGDVALVLARLNAVLDDADQSWPNSVSIDEAKRVYDLLTCYDRQDEADTNAT